jgi:hypothetical protein
MSQPLRIAMWSGPRNISTALMRSWGSRGDTFVTDEPLYAHFLAVTGFDHPGREEILTHHERDWRKVVAWLTGPVPEGKAVWYQKHMTHHLTPEVDRGWVEGLANCFLIRDPKEVITSYVKVRETPTAADLGLPQQVELFRQVRKVTGRTPPVLDARHVLFDPERLLRLLCRQLGVAFDPAMLVWEPGPRPTDGVWAPHWYANVWKSTGFGPYRTKGEKVPEELEEVYATCLELYGELAAHRLT